MSNRALPDRQSVHTADLGLFGYELLYRTGPVSHAEISDADQATGKLVVSTIMDIGLEQLVGEHRAFMMDALAARATPLAESSGAEANPGFSRESLPRARCADRSRLRSSPARPAAGPPIRLQRYPSNSGTRLVPHRSHHDTGS